MDRKAQISLHIQTVRSDLSSPYTKSLNTVKYTVFTICIRTDRPEQTKVIGVKVTVVLLYSHRNITAVCLKKCLIWGNRMSKLITPSTVCI